MIFGLSFVSHKYNSVLDCFTPEKFIVMDSDGKYYCCP
jgi:hypothetical protein